MVSFKAMLAVTLVALLVLCGAAMALAQDDPAASNSEAEPSVDVEVVVSATRTDEKATNVAATTEIVNQKQIDQSQATSVFEVLKTMPGINVVQSGSAGGVTSLFTRGGNNNQTLVTVDGVRINDPMAGGADLSNITLDGVGRIEVVKGPFGTLYGADAMSGVVSIFSRPGSQTPDEASVGAGSYGTGRASFSVGTGKGDKGLGLSASWLTTDGVRAANNKYDGISAVARWDTPLLSGNLTLTNRYFNYDAGVPGATNYLSPFDRQSVNGDIASLNWTRESVSSRDGLHVGRFQQDYELNYRDWTNNPQISRVKPRYTEASWQHDWISDHTESTLGLEWKRSEGSYDDTANGKYQAHNTSRAVFSQIQHSSGDWRLIGGIRYQDEKLFASRITYRAGVTRMLNDGKTSFWANYGTGYRVPTFNELYFPFMGNTSLVPETSKGWEVGWWNVAGKGKDLRIVYFHNDYENLIEWRPVDPVTWQPTNVADATTQGIEFEFNRKINDRWSDTLSFTRLRATTDGDPLLRRPTYSASYSISYTGDKDTLALSSCYVGKRLDAKTFPGPNEVPGYAIFDLAATHKLRSGYSLWLRVNNLLDKSYEAAANYPSPGANFLLGLSRAM